MTRTAIYLLAASILLLVFNRWGKLDFLYRWSFNLTRNTRQRVMVLRREEKKESNYEDTANLNLKIAQLEEENKAARRLLGANLSPKLKFTPAHLLGLNGESFVIDLGSHEGIAEGTRVVSENILVGKIIRVNPFCAEGIFVNNRDFKVAVGIWRPGKQLVGKGLLQGGTSLAVEEILPEEEVEKGDLVAELEGEGQFLIGKIAEVGPEAGKVFKKATVEWLTKPRQLETVFAVTR